MIKKISVLFFAALLVFTLTATTTYAATGIDGQSLSVYKYEDLTDYIESGVTFNVDGDNNEISLNGTASDTIMYEFDDLYTANDKGYSLDITKYYAVVYEYISGSITTNGGEFYPIRIFSNVGPYILDQLNIRVDMHQKDSTFLLLPNSATKNQFYADSGVEFNNLIFRIHFIEISQVDESDYDFISDLTSIVDSDITVSFPSANQIVINGTDNSSYTKITDSLNSNLLNSDDLYLFIYQYVSGDAAISLNYIKPLVISNNFQLSTNYEELEAAHGLGITDINDFYVGSNSNGVFNNYTYNIIVKKINLYDENDTGSGDTGSGDTGSGGVITPDAETLSFLGIEWYYWVSFGAIALWYFGFTKEGRKVLGIK